jgi:hypothetical protein
MIQYPRGCHLHTPHSENPKSHYHIFASETRLHSLVPSLFWMWLMHSSFCRITHSLYTVPSGRCADVFALPLSIVLSQKHRDMDIFHSLLPASVSIAGDDQQGGFYFCKVESLVAVLLTFILHTCQYFETLSNSITKPETTSATKSEVWPSYVMHNITHCEVSCLLALQCPLKPQQRLPFSGVSPLFQTFWRLYCYILNVTDMFDVCLVGYKFQVQGNWKGFRCSIFTSHHLSKCIYSSAPSMYQERASVTFPHIFRKYILTSCQHEKHVTLSLCAYWLWLTSIEL